MFEQSFKNIDNELRKDGGSSTEMDYIEQTSWILFLKYLEDLENNITEKTAITPHPNGSTVDSISPPRMLSIAGDSVRKLNI